MSFMKSVKEFYNKHSYIVWGATALLILGAAYGVRGYSRSAFDTEILEYKPWLNGEKIPELKNKELAAIDPVKALETEALAFKGDLKVYDGAKKAYDEELEGLGFFSQNLAKLTGYGFTGALTSEHPGTKPERKLGEDFTKIGLTLDQVQTEGFKFSPDQESQYKEAKVIEVEANFAKFKQLLADDVDSFKPQFTKYKNKLEAENKESYYPLAAEGTAALVLAGAAGYGIDATLGTEPQRASTPVQKTPVRAPRKQPKRVRTPAPKVKTNTTDTTTTKKSDAAGKDSKKGMSGWTIFFIVLALVAVAAAVVYFFFFYQSSEDEEFDAEAQPEL